MYTSVINYRKAKNHTIIGYGSAAVFCFIFQLIYEHFSHGVTSLYMVLAFLIPIMGGLVSLISYRLFVGHGGLLFRQLLAGSVIWLTLGSIYQGVLEIYGTTNHLIIVFAIAGALQLIAAVIIGIFSSVTELVRN